MVLVPFPITPLIAFAYFLYRYLNIVSKEVYVRYKDSAIKEATKFLGDGTTLCIGEVDLIDDLKKLLSNPTCAADGWVLKRMLTYCISANTAKSKREAEWILTKSYRNQPSDILETLACRFEDILSKRLDIWKTGLSIATLKLPTTKKGLYIPRRIMRGERPLDLPILKRQFMEFEGKMQLVLKVVSTQKYKLPKRNVWSLVGEHIAVVIGGPPSAGKSTLAASLGKEIKRNLDELKSGEGGWERLSVESDCMTIDYGTPVTPTILKHGQAFDRAELGKLKKDWTPELADQALGDFIRKKQECNLLFADLPGKVTPIAETLASAADYAITISQDWESMPEWRVFFGTMKLGLVSEVKSRPEGRPLPSLVTTYRPGSYLSGRIVGVDRLNRSWDRFISWLAEILLFDILPTMVQNRRKRLDHELRKHRS